MNDTVHLSSSPVTGDVFVQKTFSLLLAPTKPPKEPTSRCVIEGALAKVIPTPFFPYKWREITQRRGREKKNAGGEDRGRREITNGGEGEIEERRGEPKENKENRREKGGENPKREREETGEGTDREEREEETKQKKAMRQ